MYSCYGGFRFRELALKETSEEAKLRAIKLAVLILGGLGVLLYFMQGTFDFMSASDAIYRQYYGNELVNAIVADREAIFQSDSIRSVLVCFNNSLDFMVVCKRKIKTKRDDIDFRSGYVIGFMGR